MGPNGGDSGNKIGFVLLSCPPGPVRLFLLVLLHGALSAVTSPSNLFILTSSPLCSVERKKDVFSQHVPLRVNVFFSWGIGVKTRQGGAVMQRVRSKRLTLVKEQVSKLAASEKLLFCVVNWY